MSVTDPPVRPRRFTSQLRLPVPGDVDAADVPTDVGALADMLDTLLALTLPQPGDYKFTASRTPPGGWLLCDGRAVGRGVYAALFAAIGTDAGPGDGSSTFNIPDLRGCVPMGAGQGPGLTPRVNGQRLGAEVHALSVEQMPSHGHSVYDPGHAHAVADPGHGHGLYSLVLGNSGAGPGNAGLANASAGGGYWNWHNGGVIEPRGVGVGIHGAGTGVSLYGAGGSTSHPNVQPSVVGSFYIKT